MDGNISLAWALYKTMVLYGRSVLLYDTIISVKIWKTMDDFPRELKTDLSHEYFVSKAPWASNSVEMLLIMNFSVNLLIFFYKCLWKSLKTDRRNDKGACLSFKFILVCKTYKNPLTTHPSLKKLVVWEIIWPWLQIYLLRWRLHPIYRCRSLHQVQLQMLSCPVERNCL